MNNKDNGFAVASFVLGIVGLFVPGLASLLAVIFGGVGIYIAKRDGTSKDKAIGGIIFGAIALVFLLIFYNSIRLAIFGRWIY